jgi:hypothetical protein
MLSKVVWIFCSLFCLPSASLFSTASRSSTFFQTHTHAHEIMSNMDCMPLEILYGILETLDRYDLLAAAHVCCAWSATAQHIRRHRRQLMPEPFEYAWKMARRGHLRALRWVWSLGSMEGWIAFVAAERAAAGGHLPTLAWVIKVCGTQGPSIPAAAALHGHLDVIEWLCDRDCPWDGHELCCNAALGGHLDIVEWVMQHGSKWDLWAAALAASNGHANVLDWIHDNGYGWDARVIERAARQGHHDIIRWARSRGCAWPSGLARILAQNAAWDALEWAVSDGCPWGVGTAAQIARHGNLSMLKWARSRGRLWHDNKEEEEMCTRAAKGGHIHVLGWLESQGVRRNNKKTTMAAVKRGGLETAAWLLARGSPHGDGDLCDAAAMGGQLNTLKWLCANGHTCDERTFMSAVCGGSVKVIQWLNDDGCPTTRHSREYACEAARSGHVEAFQWLISHGFAWDRRECASAAFDNGQHHVLAWIVHDRDDDDVPC